MGLPPLQRSSGLYLSWIGTLCGSVVLLLGNVLPVPLPFATPAAFFISLVEVEIFFALLVWPLLVPSLQKDGIRGLALLASLGILILLALPLLLIGANVSGVGVGSLIRTQAQVFGLAALAAGIASRRRSGLPWYLLAVFALSTLPPLSYYLENQMQAKAPLATACLSPFWTAASGGAAAWVQAALTGLAGLGLLARKEPVAMIAALALVLALQNDPQIEKVERLAGDVNRPLLWTPLKITVTSAAGFEGDLSVRSEFGFQTSKKIQLAAGGRATLILPALEPQDIVAGKTVHKLSHDFVRPDRIVLVDTSLPYAGELASTSLILYQKISPEDLQATRPRGLLEVADLVLTKGGPATKADAEKAVAALGEPAASLEAVDRNLWTLAPGGGWVPTKKDWALYFATVYALAAFVALAVMARRFPKFGLACVGGVAVLGMAGYAALFPRHHLWAVCDQVEDRAGARTHRVWFLNAAADIVTRVEFPLLVKPIFPSSAGTEDAFELRVDEHGCSVEGLHLGPTRSASFGATELKSDLKRPNDLSSAVLVRNGRAKYLGDIGGESPLPETVEGENAGLRSPAYAAWSRFVGKDGLFGELHVDVGPSRDLVSPDLADERVRHLFEIRGVK